MGGRGSGGRNSRGRIVAESTLRLDIRELRRRGTLTAGRRGSIKWTCGDGSSSSVGFTGASDAIQLSYTWGDRYSGEQHLVAERLMVVSRPCRFGGARHLFQCPGCYRQALVLYFRGGRFNCRACVRVAYASQNERPIDRARRRAQKIRHRLGADPSFDDPIPERPKGMWRRTYERMVARLIAAEDAEAVALLPIVHKILARNFAKSG